MNKRVKREEEFVCPHCGYKHDDINDNFTVAYTIGFEIECFVCGEVFWMERYKQTRMDFNLDGIEMDDEIDIEELYRRIMDDVEQILDGDYIRINDIIKEGGLK